MPQEPGEEPVQEKETPRRYAIGVVVVVLAMVLLVAFAVATFVLSSDSDAGSTQNPTDNPPTSGVSERAPYRAELRVNTTAPTPTELVTATLAMTNIGNEPFEMAPLCASDILLVPTSNAVAATRSTTIEAPTTSASPQDLLAQSFWHLSGGSPFEATAEAARALDQSGPCAHNEKIELQPGASTSVDGYLQPGLLGWGQDLSLLALPLVVGEPRVVMPFTMPDVPDGVLTRQRAIDILVAQPAASAWFSRSSGDVSTEEGLASGPPRVGPVGNGWRISMALGSHRLDVTLDGDGHGTLTTDGIESSVDPSLTG